MPFRAARGSPGLSKHDQHQQLLRFRRHDMYWSQIGTTYPVNVPSVNIPSTGLFTTEASYGLQNCTDGSSNTIAFVEAAVGSQTAQLGQKLVGVVNVTAIQPY